MKHKTIAIWATIMAAVFLVIIVAYPMLFNPNSATPLEPSPTTTALPVK